MRKIQYTKRGFITDIIIIVMSVIIEYFRYAKELEIFNVFIGFLVNIIILMLVNILMSIVYKGTKLVVLKLKYLYLKNKEKIRAYRVLIFILVLVLIVPLIIHIIFFENENSLSEKDLLSFYGSYITFSGTFVLSYIVYKMEKRNRIEDKVIYNSRLLYSCIDEIIDQFKILNDKPEIITKIVYDHNWKQYYYELSVGKLKNNQDIEDELKFIFKYVSYINECLAKNKKDEAIIEYKLFIKYEVYYPTKFNYIEIMEIFHDIGFCHLNNEFNISWKDKKDNIDKIYTYKNKYFNEIEDWIYKYMINNKITKVKKDDFIIQLNKHLYYKYEELRNIVITVFDRRIISEIIINVILMFNKKSKYLDFVWDEIELREKL